MNSIFYASVTKIDGTQVACGTRLDQPARELNRL